MITVMLADDHALFRRGLRSMLEFEDDIEVIGEAGDGQEAQELARELKPDVAILDINMPGVNGIEAARELRRTFPRMGIIMLTMFAEEEIIEQALAAGADDYLRKDTPFDEIVGKVRSTAGGRTKPAETAPVGGNASGAQGLTDSALLRRIVDGLSDREIAAETGVTEAAVQQHLAALYRRLGVKDRTQAAIYALTQGADKLRD